MATQLQTTEDDKGLRELLKRCSHPTYEAAAIFRATGNPRYLPAVVRGILEPHIDETLRPRLDAPSETVRLSEDLGVDSLTLMEIALVAEDAVGFPVTVEELRGLKTVGEIERALASKR